MNVDLLIFVLGMFAYYESFIDYYQVRKDSNLSAVPRTLTSPLYNGTFWRNPRIKFNYHAFGVSLGNLCKVFKLEALFTNK